EILGVSSIPGRLAIARDRAIAFRAKLAMAFSAPAVARSIPEEDRPGSFAWVKFRAFFAGQVDPPRANDFSRYSNPHDTE
ncbi:hypothetical protein, partial [Xanthomonas axonopodis]|uniref:hypothetical protein n=1 Tax=Xanthomonas axonopodis TaxID=53413 RepID=UPI001C0CE468